jgi:hypothetical protein
LEFLRALERVSASPVEICVLATIAVETARGL